MNSYQWWFSQFPESLFPVETKYRKDYNRKTITGHARMAQSSVVVCGIGRNIEKVLPFTIARIERLRLFFEDSYVVVYTNDNEDRTSLILNNWKKSVDGVTVLEESLNKAQYIGGTSLDRRVDMAYYRNQYLNYIKENLTQKVDYVIVVDIDMLGGFSYEGIANSFGQNNWDFIGANGLLFNIDEQSCQRLHYDAYAFRRLNHPQEHEQPEINVLEYKRGESLIRVLSCFGGVGIYPFGVIKQFSYTQDDCDHVTIHKQMHKDGYQRIYLNPSLLTIHNSLSSMEI